MKKPHKHAELIKAWADGAEIQVRMFNSGRGWSEWEDHPFPCWTTNGRIHFEYRIKPEPKPDFEIFYFYKNGELLSASYENKDPNLKLIFTGEGKLKDAEVLE
jgi:hypothetical protein